MTFDILVYCDFVSGLPIRNFTDSEFWQNSGSFADIAISLTSMAWGQRPKKTPLTEFSCLPRSGAHTTNDFTRLDLTLTSNIIGLMASSLNATIYSNDYEAIWDIWPRICLKQSQKIKLIFGFLEGREPNWLGFVKKSECFC